ncbi:protein of unknown function [Pseudomonas lundensis]|jgi:transmembrane sensor|uniref:Anti-sigma factor, FecR family protein n=1 Tax=Pseudomonas lundensis TaxID=86185 RepID=A0AAP6YR70_9PSED|nr:MULTISPECIES: DUF4880 domain-containing protein [Pseudomonas]KMM96171.1 hypothetical protein TU74_02765 [Pseudomonas lundensis]MBM1181733.1 DUF4880 domain-containing protein [Pseudomonas lundensis]MBM1187909.1 DUF4880 domain-containing protein [Pseudomonas lundensis]MBS5840775.1 DUF4880 domain-containing protein [Pseudomonas sp.]NNA00274.1 DUF4880 domain-containing protein [Pseudomonas lundensis]
MSKSSVDPITRAAVDWMLLLESGHACPSERQVFKAWLAENPKHLAAWLRVANVQRFNPRTPAADPDLLKLVQRALDGRSFFSRHKALQHALLAFLVGLGVLASGLLCQG